MFIERHSFTQVVCPGAPDFSRVLRLLSSAVRCVEGKVTGGLVVRVGLDPHRVITGQLQ